MDSSPPTSEQASTPRKPNESDENDCGFPRPRPNSSDRKKSASKKKILADINEFCSGNVAEPHPSSEPGETPSPGSESGKPSLSPYDPIKNYLSPRPKYLRYKPNRRREIALRLEKEIELREDSFCDCAREADFEDSNSANTPASSANSIIPEDILKPEKEESDDYDEEIEDDEEEEEEEEDEGSTAVGLLKFLLLLVVLIISSSCICNMNASSPSMWPIKGIEDEYICQVNGNSTLEGDLSEILDQEESYLVHRDWTNIRVDFSFEDGRAVVAETQHMDAEEVKVGSNAEYVVEEKVEEGEDVPTAEAGSNGESVDSGAALQQTCRESADISDRITDSSQLKRSETEVAPNVLHTENPEGGEEAPKQTDAGILELQNTESDRSVDALSAENLEELGISMMAQSKMGIWSGKGVLVGLIESNWILKVAIGFAISSLLLGVCFLCKKKVRSHSSSGKKSYPIQTVVEIKSKFDELQLNQNEDEEKNFNMCSSLGSPSPSVRPSIIEEEDSVSIHSRVPTVELLGELLVTEISNSVKRSNVSRTTNEPEESTHSISIQKTKDDSKYSSTSSRRFRTTCKITSPREEEGAGEGSLAASSMTSTPVRRSSRIRSRTVQSPGLQSSNEDRHN